MSRNKVKRVGFDLDGVILYNPARMARPFVALAKALIARKRQGIFLIPNSPLQRFIWDFLHRSSLFISPGFKEVERLVKEGKIEAYIISARYDFLQKDLQGWLKKLKFKKYFRGCYTNMDNEQPHLFKKRLLSKLKFDFYVEDNWDVVKALKIPGLKVFWISNIFDYWIKHPHKFLNLKKAVLAIENELKKD